MDGRTTHLSPNNLTIEYSLSLVNIFLKEQVQRNHAQTLTIFIHPNYKTHVPPNLQLIHHTYTRVESIHHNIAPRNTHTPRRGWKF